MRSIVRAHVVVRVAVLSLSPSLYDGSDLYDDGADSTTIQLVQGGGRAMAQPIRSTPLPKASAL